MNCLPHGLRACRCCLSARRDPRIPAWSRKTLLPDVNASTNASQDPNSDPDFAQPCGCGGLRALEQLSCPKKGPQAHPDTRELVGSALLPVDHTDRCAALQAGLAKRLDGRDCGASGGHDILDEAHPLASLEGALDAVGGAVVLRLLADDQERQPRGERRGGGEGNGAELGACEPRSGRFVLADDRGDSRADRLEELRLRLEAVLVEVVGGAAAGAEDEITLEEGVLAERRPQLVIGHARSSSSSRASSRRSSASTPRSSRSRDASS